jgi:murein DD-endopeptidase MepM/ murein hydrolase activator NlpD
MQLRRLRCEALEPRLMLAKDLEIVSVQLVNAVGEATGATPVVGEKVYAVVHYRSTDLAPADVYNIRWEMDGVATEQFSFVGVPGVGVDLFWFHGGWIAPSGGSHTVTVTVDSGGAVAEANEANNSTSTAAFTADPPTSLAEKFALPIAGVQNVDWVMGGYVDVNPKFFADDPNDFFQDFQGNKSTTRDFHNGIDIALANFRAQDDGVSVLAAAAGTVVDVRDGRFDRETALQFADVGNYVFIDHGNGWVSQYYHLRRDSILVSVGQAVVAGQPLGLVGSSGNSAGPHLHFEVQHNKSPVDLFAAPASYWLATPPYVYDPVLPHTLIDSGVTNDVYDGVHTFLGPPLEHFLEKPSDIAVFAPGAEVYAYATFASVRAGDTWKAQLYRPNGTLVNNFGPATFPADRPLDGGWYRPGFTEDVPGAWRVDFLYNDVKFGESTFTVASAPAVGKIRLFDDHAGVDTYIIDGRTTPIDFGKVDFGGAPPTRTFTVENHGYGAVSGLSATLPAGYSIVEPLAASLAPGASDAFTVRLDADAVGYKPGQISVSDGASLENIAFAVEGRVSGNAADFDDDGRTDGADFLAWQRHVGVASGALKIDGDANGDGAVGAADLEIWKTQFGLPPGASAAAAARAGGIPPGAFLQVHPPAASAGPAERGGDQPDPEGSPTAPPPSTSSAPAPNDADVPGENADGAVEPDGASRRGAVPPGDDATDAALEGLGGPAWKMPRWRW